MGDHEKGRLDSWKAIADYIGRDVRTAIRWEHERGLPVHRVPGGKRGAVFAFAGEIDQWLLRSGGPPNGGAYPAEPGPSTAALRSSWTRSRWIGALAAALALALLGLAVQASIARRQHHRTPVAAISLAGTELVVRGPGDDVLWRHDFGRPVAARAHPRAGGVPAFFSADHDIDGDGSPDLIVSVPFILGRTVAARESDELFAFSAQGRVLWSYRLEDELRFGEGSYGAPWRLAGPLSDLGPQVSVFDVDGEKRIAWAQCHATWWPSILSVLDASGRRISAWVHSGVIYAVAAMAGREGPVLLAGGVSNSREAAFLAVLDARRIEGAGPEDVESTFHCRSCGEVRPLRYFVIEPSDVALAVAPYNFVSIIRTDERGVEVRTRESPSSAAHAAFGVARFDANFSLEHASWDSMWTRRHRALEREESLDHPVERCPERDRPPRVREWTPARGWRDVTPGALVASARGGTASVRQ